MKIIIGLLVIIPAVYTFFKYKPQNIDVLKMFLVNVVFGIMTMCSTMAFDSTPAVILSLAAIAGIIVMNCCYYVEMMAEVKRRKRKAAKNKLSKAATEKNICSVKEIPFVA